MASILNYFGGTPQFNQWGPYYAGYPGGCPLPTCTDNQSVTTPATFNASSGINQHHGSIGKRFESAIGTARQRDLECSADHR
jgi:hypothetical protein